MESFIVIAVIIYITINIISCLWYSFEHSEFFDFLMDHIFIGFIGFPGLILGLFGRKLVEDQEWKKREAEATRRREEEKREQEKERIAKENKSKEIQENLEKRAMQIEHSEMFKKLLSFIAETETPNQIDIEAEQVTIYLIGRTRTFNFLLNGIENVSISRDKDDDSRNSDLYAIAFALNKTINANYTITPNRKFNKWGNTMFYVTTKVTLKRKLPSII